MTEEKKTPAELRQAERDSIIVQSSKKDDDGNPIVDKKADDAKPTDDGAELAGDSKEDKQEVVAEAKEEKIEASEKTEEDLEAEKLEAKTAAEKARIQKRIDKEVAKRKVLEDEVTELKKLLAAKEGDGEKLTKEDVEKEAKRIAIELNNERQFTADCNRLADAAKKLDKEFDSKMKSLAEDVAPIPGYMIGALADLKNNAGGAVLKYFTDNPDIYEDVIALPPMKMVGEIKDISFKLEAETKPKPKAVSKVPAPNEPVGGKGGSNSMVITEADTKDMQTFVKKRQMQLEERNRLRRARMR